MKVPRFLVIQQEVDYYLWVLGNMYQEDLKLQPIERMIDEATGFDKKKMAEVEEITSKVKKLIKEYNKIMGIKC